MEDKNKTNKDDKFEDDEEFIVEEDIEMANKVAGSKLKELRKKLSDCEAEKKDYMAGWQRSKADMVNLRKKFDDEKKHLLDFSEKGLIEDLLPALESFEMAFKDKKVWDSVPENWRSGVEYIYNQIWESLSSRGLLKVEPQVGDVFDPSQHESVQNISVIDRGLDSTIASVVRTGYKLKGAIIRPARVSVNHFDN